MGITIEEILKLEIMASSTLLAGFKGLDRVTNWTAVLEVLDDISLLQKGDFLVTTAFGLEKDDYLINNLIPVLIKLEVSGIAIQTGYYLETIPIQLIRQCNEYNLPLIQIPKYASFTEITKAVLKKIISKNEVLLEHTLKISNNFTNVILNNEGLPKISHLLSELLNTPIQIFDKDFLLLASCGIKPPSPYLNPESVQAAYQALINRNLIDLDSIYSSFQLELFGLSPQMPDHVLIPLITGNKIHGYMSIFTSTGDFKQIDQNAILTAATTCTLEILKESAIREAEDQIRGDFLDNLIENNYQTEETMSRRASYLGYSPSSSHVVICIDIDDLSLKGDRDVLEIKRRFKSLVHLSLQVEKKRAITKYVGNRLILLLEVDRNSVQYINSTLLNRIKRAAKSALSTTLTIGIGRVYPKLSNVSQSYHEAQKALAIGKKLWKNDRIIHYDDIGIFSFFVNTENRPEQLDFLNKTLLPLLEYEKKHKLELIETLKAYIETNGYHKEIVDKLFIHRHTLRYRLKRIKDITGLDPENCRDLLQLQVGLIVYLLTSEEK